MNSAEYMCTICQGDSSQFDAHLPSDCLAKPRVRKTDLLQPQSSAFTRSRKER